MIPYGLVGGYQLSGGVEASVLKTEEIRFSETLVHTYQTTRYHNPEDHNLEYRFSYIPPESWHPPTWLHGVTDPKTTWISTTLITWDLIRVFHFFSSFHVFFCPVETHSLSPISRNTTILSTEPYIASLSVIQEAIVMRLPLYLDSTVTLLQCSSLWNRI
jgi:hypothetical protein